MSLQYCSSCKNYTLKATCSECGEQTITPKPPKYSPHDRYGEYRREAKRRQGLL